MLRYLLIIVVFIVPIYFRKHFTPIQLMATVIFVAMLENAPSHAQFNHRAVFVVVWVFGSLCALKRGQVY